MKLPDPFIMHLTVSGCSSIKTVREWSASSPLGQPATHGAAILKTDDTYSLSTGNSLQGAAAQAAARCAFCAAAAHQHVERVPHNNSTCHVLGQVTCLGSRTAVLLSLAPHTAQHNHAAALPGWLDTELTSM